VFCVVRDDFSLIVNWTVTNGNQCKVTEKYVFISIYTGRFIMFSVITNVYNKKTKGPTLMELFTAIWKLKKLFLATRDVRCVYHGWHGTHRYDIQVLQWLMGDHLISAQTPSFSKLFIPSTNGLVCRRVLCLLCTKCTLHSNHRLNRVIFQQTKDFSPGAAIFSLHTIASPGGRNVNYNEKQLTGKKIFELFLLYVQVS